MTAKIQIRRDTTTNWNTGSPTLSQGELGYDTTLNQLKIGTNVSPTAWASLPWLTGTFPVFSSPASTDLNSATNSVQGVYRFSSGSGLTNGPAAPIDIKAADGGVSMLVCTFGAIVLQQLWTDGDGTQPQKTYSRIFDTAWRSWIAQNAWGVSATEGVDVVAKSITLKDTGTGLTVDGNSTLNGTTTLGNADADIVTVQAGTAADPIITTAGDTNTGIYFPAADSVAMATNGTARLTVANAGVTIANNLTVSGALAALLNCGSFRLTSVADATSLTDGLNLQSLLDRIAIIAPASSAGTTYTASNGASWTLTSLNPVTWTATSPSGGNYDGIIIALDGAGSFQPAYCKVFNNDPSPIQANAGLAAYGMLIAIKRS